MRILLEWLGIRTMLGRFIARQKWRVMGVVTPVLALFVLVVHNTSSNLVADLDEVYRFSSVGAQSEGKQTRQSEPLFKLVRENGVEQIVATLQAPKTFTVKNNPQQSGENFEQARHCLAQAMYFEARSEPIEGWQAVGDVVINRVRDQRYPNTVCDVVFQGEFRRHNCQFSFACDGRSDRAYNKSFWQQAYDLAGELLIKGSNSEVAGIATHYHADYVEPQWSVHMQPVTKIGRHIFYVEDESGRKPLPLARPQRKAENNL